MSVCVFLFDLADVIVDVLELAVHVETLIGLCVREVIGGVCFRVCVLLCRTSSRVRDLVDPAPEAADSRVQSGRGGVGAAITPGNDPGKHPSARLLLTHQPASGVALATVVMEETGVRRTAGTKGAMSGEAVAVTLLTLP